MPAPGEEDQSIQTYNVIYEASHQPTIDPVQVLEEVKSADNTKLDTIMTTLETVLENQHKIIKELANFQVVFEKAMKKKNAGTAFASSSQNTSRIVPFQPIDCSEDLKELNEKLEDTDVFSEYVERLSFICGRDTTTKGIDHCYMLVDKFFTRKFFTLCSWAGGSKVPNTKFAFKFYENVISLFFKLIHLADPKFTLEDCEDFFKSVIRNCVRRNNSSNLRTSRSKNRPKQLSYNAQVAENDEVNGGTTSMPNNLEDNLGSEYEVSQFSNEGPDAEQEN